MAATADTDTDATAADTVGLEVRDVRALTECLTVLEDVGRVRGAEDLFLVVSESGSEYLVDRRTGRCGCPDAVHRWCTAGRQTAPSSDAAGGRFSTTFRPRGASPATS